MRADIRLWSLAIAAILSCGADWPQFRGNGGGVAPDGAPPTSWNGETGERIAWKVPVPGRGPSSPIVVRDRVIVTSSDGANQQSIHILCFDGQSGEQLWQRQFWATGRTACHPESANAAPTPASDGERIFAFYSSNDLVCLDLDGNLLWYRGLAHDYPKAGNDVGMASSPVVAAGTVVVQIENQGESFAAGIDAETGETRWRLERPPVANWTSPALWQSADKSQSLVLLQSPSELTAVEPATGQVIWRHQQSCDAIPSPTLLEDKAVFVAADRLVTLDLSTTRSPSSLWDAARLRPGASSPVVVGDRVYTVNRVGVLACADLQSGEVRWQLRLKGEFWGTPAVAGDHLFLVNKEGIGLVVKLGDEQGEIVGENPLGDRVMSSPAISGNALFVRSDSKLWKIAAE